MRETKIDRGLGLAMKEAEGEPVLSREDALKCLEKDEIKCKHRSSKKLKKVLLYTKRNI